VSVLIGHGIKVNLMGRGNKKDMKEKTNNPHPAFAKSLGGQAELCIAVSAIVLMTAEEPQKLLFRNGITML